MTGKHIRACHLYTETGCILDKTALFVADCPNYHFTNFSLYARGKDTDLATKDRLGKSIYFNDLSSWK